jgi:pyridoxal phosphate-dependent aminotransferase EpsN
MSTYKIYLSPPFSAPNTKCYVQEAIDSGWMAPAGPFVDRFESLLRAYHGVAAVALSSGTAALHLALKAAGVRAGDVVLLPSFTFVATCNAVCYLGAEPVFIDSDTTHWHMSVKATAHAMDTLKKQGRRIGALLCVHLYGAMAPIEELRSVAENHGVPLVEDAAEALGVRWKGQLAGTFGCCAALSFNGNKIITTSGGGAFLSADENLAKKALYWATQAKQTAAGDWHHEEVGYNYRMSNLLAAVGCAQMEYLPNFIVRKYEIAQLYRQLLKEAEQKGYLRWQPPLPEVQPTYWLNCLLFATPAMRARVMEQLMRQGIECRRLWKPLHQQPLAAGSLFFQDGNSAEYLYEHGLCLPSGYTLTTPQQSHIAELIMKALGA